MTKVKKLSEFEITDDDEKLCQEIVELKNNLERMAGKKEISELTINDRETVELENWLKRMDDDLEPVDRRFKRTTNLNSVDALETLDEQAGLDSVITCPHCGKQILEIS